MSTVVLQACQNEEQRTPVPKAAEDPCKKSLCMEVDANGTANLSFGQFALSIPDGRTKRPAHNLRPVSMPHVWFCWPQPEQRECGPEDWNYTAMLQPTKPQPVVDIGTARDLIADRMSGYAGPFSTADERIREYRISNSGPMVAFVLDDPDLFGHLPAAWCLTENRCRVDANVGSGFTARYYFTTEQVESWPELNARVTELLAQNTPGE